MNNADFIVYSCFFGFYLAFSYFGPLERYRVEWIITDSWYFLHFFDYFVNLGYVYKDFWKCGFQKLAKIDGD